VCVFFLPVVQSSALAILAIAFLSDLAYAANPTGELMQQNPNAATTVAVCVWCCSQFLKGTSRARDTQTFCSKKCETEARYWLYESLKPATE
jgi:hypothetical protein